MLVYTDAFGGGYWFKSPAVSVQLVEDGWWEVTRAEGAVASANMNQSTSAVPNDVDYTATFEVRAGTATSLAFGIYRGVWDATKTSFEILSGPGQLGSAMAGVGLVSNLSATIPTKVRVTRLTASTDTWTAMSLIFYPVDLLGSAGSIKVRKPQLEIGSTPTPYQKVDSQYDVTEVGVPDVWHLSNDGGDSLSVTLPAGTYGRAWVDSTGLVTVDTVVDPTNALVSNQQVDIILRQGAFTPEEEAKIRTYWARYAA